MSKAKLIIAAPLTLGCVVATGICIYKKVTTKKEKLNIEDDIRSNISNVTSENQNLTDSDVLCRLFCKILKEILHEIKTGKESQSVFFIYDDSFTSVDDVNINTHHEVIRITYEGLTIKLERSSLNDTNPITKIIINNKEVTEIDDYDITNNINQYHQSKVYLRTIVDWIFTTVRDEHTDSRQFSDEMYLEDDIRDTIKSLI